MEDVLATDRRARDGEVATVAVVRVRERELAAVFPRDEVGGDLRAERARRGARQVEQHPALRDRGPDEVRLIGEARGPVGGPDIDEIDDLDRLARVEHARIRRGVRRSAVVAARRAGAAATAASRARWSAVARALVERRVERARAGERIARERAGDEHREAKRPHASIVAHPNARTSIRATWSLRPLSSETTMSVGRPSFSTGPAVRPS